MSNIYAESKISAFFPGNQSRLVDDSPAVDGIHLISDKIPLGNPKSGLGIQLETHFDRNLLPPMKVKVIFAKILFLTLQVKLDNIHVVHIDTLSESGVKTTAQIFSTSARFFMEQSKYDTHVQNRQLNVSPRHSLRVVIDKDGKMKVENLFKKVVLNIFIKFSGIGILMDIKANISYWKASRNYVKEVREASKNGITIDNLKLSTNAWLYLMNNCLKTGALKHHESSLTEDSNNIRLVFGRRIYEEINGHLPISDSDAVQVVQEKVEEKPKVLKMVEGNKYQYNFLPRGITVEEIKIIERFVFEKMTTTVMSGFAKHIKAGTYYYDPKTNAIDSGFKVTFPNGINFAVILDRNEFNLYHNDPTGYCNYKIVEQYFRILSDQEKKARNERAEELHYLNERQQAEKVLLSETKKTKGGLYPWESHEKVNKKRTGNILKDEVLYNAYVDAKVRELRDNSAQGYLNVPKAWKDGRTKGETYSNEPSSTRDNQQSRNNYSPFSTHGQINGIQSNQGLHYPSTPNQNNEISNPNRSVINTFLESFKQMSWSKKSDAVPFTIYGDRNSDHNRMLIEYNDKLHSWDNKNETVYYNGTPQDELRERRNKFERESKEFDARMAQSNKVFEQAKESLAKYSHLAEPIKFTPIQIPEFKPLNLPKLEPIEIKKFDL